MENRQPPFIEKENANAAYSYSKKMRMSTAFLTRFIALPQLVLSTAFSKALL